MTLYKHKSYLHEITTVGVSLLIEQQEEGVVCSSLLPELNLNEGWSECSPEKLVWMLCLQKRFGKVNEALLTWVRFIGVLQSRWFKDLVSSSWGGHKVHNPKNFTNMASVLLVSDVGVFTCPHCDTPFCI